MKHIQQIQLLQGNKLLVSQFSGEEMEGFSFGTFVRDSSAGVSDMMEAGEELVDVADSIISSAAQGQGGIRSGSKYSEMKQQNAADV